MRTQRLIENVVYFKIEHLFLHLISKTIPWILDNGKQGHYNYTQKKGQFSLQKIQKNIKLFKISITINEPINNTK